MGLEVGWNCHISLSASSIKHDDHVIEEESDEEEEEEDAGFAQQQQPLHPQQQQARRRNSYRISTRESAESDVMASASWNRVSFIYLRDGCNVVGQENLL